MSDVVTNFLAWFYPDVSSIPEPIMVLLGTFMLGAFFGLLFRILGGNR